MGTVISLCDLTGKFVEPWVEAGHDAILIDPQHGEHQWAGPIQKYAYTVGQALPLLQATLRSGDVLFVAGFPPCTDLSVSGARWFAEKRKLDPMFQARAVSVAEQCRTVGALSGAPWFVENPVSVLASVFGRPDHYFHPYEYTAYAAEDNYTKKTCLWSGGGFRMPAPNRLAGLADPDDRIHKAPPSAQRANIRSATPLGFARAVFAANQLTLSGNR